MSSSNPSDQTMYILEDNSNRPLFSQPSSISPSFTQTKKGFFQKLASLVKYLLFSEEEFPYSTVYPAQPSQNNAASGGNQRFNVPLYSSYNPPQTTNYAYPNTGPTAYKANRNYGIQSDSTNLCNAGSGTSLLDNRYDSTNGWTTGRLWMRALSLLETRTQPVGIPRPNPGNTALYWCTFVCLWKHAILKERKPASCKPANPLRSAASWRDRQLQPWFSP